MKKRGGKLRTNNGVILSLILIQFQENHFPKAAILINLSMSKKKLKQKGNHGKPVIVY